MTRWYWGQVGGTLIEEFVAVEGRADRGRRVLDGVIIPDGPFELAAQRDVSIRARDIIVVQTKASRLGMYLMGQALFSARLMERFGPRSIRSVALCARDDAELRPLLEVYPGLSVVVAPMDAITTLGVDRVEEDPTDVA